MIQEALDIPWKQEDGKSMRSSMTHDLIERLKPAKKKDGREMVEPDERWRYAYARAVSDLGADPTDSGRFHHQALDRCAERDPSPAVRSAAAAASASLGTRTGWKHGSSKRMLLQAWWWIRQAHSLSLGAEIDRDAALRRRDAESRI